MIAFAEREFASHRSQGRRVVVAMPPPSATAYLWSWFHELSSQRQSGMNGPLPLTYQEIEAWSKLSRIRLAPWEVSVLRRLDAAWMVFIASPNAPTPPPLTDDGELNREEIGRRLDKALSIFG